MTPTAPLLSLLGACLLVGCATTAPAPPAVQDAPVYGQETGPPRHHVQVFGGVSKINDNKTDGLTGGLSYEYRVTDGWGIGGFIDNTDETFLETTRYGGALYLHPAANWVGVVGFGLSDKVSNSLLPVQQSGTDTFTRIGAGYELQWGPWSVTPNVNMDFIDGIKVWVYGVSLGARF